MSRDERKLTAEDELLAQQVAEQLGGVGIVTDPDIELKALGAIVAELNRLNLSTRRRVMRYLTDRYADRGPLAPGGSIVVNETGRRGV